MKVAISVKNGNYFVFFAKIEIVVYIISIKGMYPWNTEYLWVE